MMNISNTFLKERLMEEPAQRILIQRNQDNDKLNIAWRIKELGNGRRDQWLDCVLLDTDDSINKN